MNRNDDRTYFRKPEDYRIVSGKKSNYVHVDAYEKVTGHGKYAGDFQEPGMLTCKFKFSSHPRAKILSIDTSKAEALPGVFVVLTGKDFAKGIEVSHVGARKKPDKEILVKQYVRHIGDQVCAVCAIDEETALKAVDLIDIEYEVLPGLFDAMEALDGNSVDVQCYGKEPHNVGPCCHQQGSIVGADIDDEFARAAYVQVNDFTTHHICHCPMETHAAFVTYNSADELWTVRGSCTSSFGVQNTLANTFGKSVTNFHVIRPYIGGAFGGKGGCPNIVIIACECARRTGRPVRFVLTREEEFITQQGRHPFNIHSETAFDSDGRIIAKKAVQILDGGAYGEASVASVNLSALWASFPYKIDTIDILSKRMFTNKSYNGAMRGFTCCQVAFSQDLMMEEAAEHFNMDSLEFRKISALETGYKAPSGTVITSCAMKQTIDDAAAYMNWPECKKELRPSEGIGFSSTAFVSGTANPLLPTPNQCQTNATVRVDFHGVVSLYSNCHDNGQGADTVSTAIVAEELGLDMSDVKLIQSSTFNAGYDSGSYGSRVTFLGGNAVRRGAVEVKKKLLECIGAKWGVEPHLLELIDHKVICRDMGKEDLEISWKDAVYHYMTCHGGDELIGVGSYYHRTNTAQYQGKPSNYAPSYVFSTSACKLTVDEETGVVDIHDFFFAHDCGQALNPRAVEGQLEGSVYSGIGYTLYENLIEVEGRQMNNNFHDYRIPTALDIPPIHTKYDYPPEPEGPFGAKECGEGTTAPIAPAVANAIRMATGIRINTLPLDPEHVWRMLCEQKGSKV